MTNRERELIWAAGIIQGEGCIGLYRFRKQYKNRISFYPTPKVSVTQGEPDVEMLDRLVTLWGGKVYRSSPPRKKHWTQTYEWGRTSRQALRICQELLALPEFRGPKRVKAQEVVDHYEEMDRDDG